ncbi:uncharacterized protein LOC135702734 [Ochlerotatus camptorhynchus]|uniref:uncharacterized protein LOC135702734 n=1 Tax=Ochlerotatus camptorhynchus TaxID=644619 RepID=UPI0031DB01B3
MASVQLVVLGVLGLLLVSGNARAELHMEPATLKSALFMKHVIEECRNTTGDDEAFMELVSFMQSDTPQCFMQHVNMTYMHISLDDLSKAELAKLLGDICGQLEKAVVCIEPIVDKIKPCIKDEDDIQMLTKIVNTVPEALKVLCNNSGAMLSELREPLYRSCAVELAPGIADCIGVISNSTMRMNRKGYTVNECNEIHEMRDCFDRNIRECGALIYLELFNLFFRNLISLTPCK